MNEDSMEDGSDNQPVAGPIENGTIAVVDGTDSIFYDGYWIRRYEVPTNEDAARRDLIDGLTKRVFHHTEPGINTPGYKLNSAREAFEAEQDPERKRVNAAMLAGALLNRGSDIFGMIFDMKQRGIEITDDNGLLLECESCFLEALDLGKQVLHYSGEEGLDELWGEPLKVFSTPIAEYYESRYIKIAQTMVAIDDIVHSLTRVVRSNSAFDGAERRLNDYAIAAKREIETMKTDPAIFKVWPEFVASGDALYRFKPNLANCDLTDEQLREAINLIREGKKLMQWIAFARVPMPKTTSNFLADCDSFVAKVNPDSAAA